MDLSYILNQLGEDRENYFNAVSPPIIQSSNFAFKTVDELCIAMKDELQAHLYTRGNNPTVEIARKKIAALEETEDCLLFSSGVAAMSAAVLSIVKSFDHIICIESPYSWTKHLCTEILPDFQIETTFVDGSETKNIIDAIQSNTKLIILESPNTFWFNLQDLESICLIAKSNNIYTIIDNSYCTPLYQKPSLLGVDLIIHTATKYLAGHSDIVCGVVCGKKEQIHKIFKHQLMCFGAIPSPHDAWLLIRGLRTLQLRLDKSAENAELLITYLEMHSKVEKIIYPFHSSHKQFALAQKQMKRGSGLFAILLKTSETKKIELFCNSLQRFLLAVSWGGHESLIFPAYIKNDPQYPNNYVRIYAGIENATELIADLDQALKRI